VIREAPPRKRPDEPDRTGGGDNRVTHGTKRCRARSSETAEGCGKREERRHHDPRLLEWLARRTRGTREGSAVVAQRRIVLGTGCRLRRPGRERRSSIKPHGSAAHRRCCAVRRTVHILPHNTRKLLTLKARDIVQRISHRRLPAFSPVPNAVGEGSWLSRAPDAWLDGARYVADAMLQPCRPSSKRRLESWWPSAQRAELARA
jgi:hypothetical protein